MQSAKIQDDRPDGFQILPATDGEGKPIFAVLVKRTYDIRPGGKAGRAESDQPLRRIDQYWEGGDPEWSTVQYETDLVAFKVATDVVVIGNAHAPGSGPATECDVAVRVGGHGKTVRIIGNRRCAYRKNSAPSFTDPEEFSTMEIRYDRAYGGWDRVSDPDLPFAYPRNPMGRGLALRNFAELIEGLTLPNLEDPNDLLTPHRLILGEPTGWNDQPLPQGLGWFQRTWYPRCSFVSSIPGFVDLATPLREEELGLVPKNQVALARQFKLPAFDARFNSGASPGLVLPYLTGNELVELTNLTPDGQLSFSLPGDKPSIMLDIGLGENPLDSMLHTVCIRPDDLQVDLVWRGAHEYPGVDWLPEMKRLRAEVV